MKKLCLLVLFGFILTACDAGNILSSGGTDKIIFGTGTFEEGITDKKSTFSADEDFYLETNLSKPFGTSEVTFSILQVTNDMETIYEEWNDTVDPSWNYFFYEFQLVEHDGEFDLGDYILRMYSDQSDLIAEGKFRVE